MVIYFTQCKKFHGIYVALEIEPYADILFKV